MSRILGGDHGQKNRQHQKASACDNLHHTVPVALVRRRHGEIRLVRADKAPVDREAVATGRADRRSILEKAQELEEMRNSGAATSFSALARRAGLTRHRARQLLKLVKLHPEVLNYLVKTRDEHGRIRERHLRPLGELPASQQVEAFKRLLVSLGHRGGS